MASKPIASTCPPAPNNFAISGAHTSNAPRRNDHTDAYTEPSSDAGVYPAPLFDPNAPEIDVKAELSRDPIPEEARSVWNSVVQDLDAAVASRAGALRLFLMLEERMSRVLTSFGVRGLLSPSVRAALAFEQSPNFVRLRPKLDSACRTWNIPPCVLVFCHLDQVPPKQARLIRSASKTGTAFPTFLQLLLLSVRSRRTGEGKMPGVNRTSDKVQPYDLNRALDWISAMDPKATIGKGKEAAPCIKNKQTMPEPEPHTEPRPRPKPLTSLLHQQETTPPSTDLGSPLGNISAARLDTILEVNESTISTSPGFPHLVLRGNVTQRRGSRALSARQSQDDVETHAGKGASDYGSCESRGNDYSSAQEYHDADVLGSDDEAADGSFLYSHRAPQEDLNNASNNDEEDPERGRKAESRQPSPFSESIPPVEDKSRRPSPFSESIPPVEDKSGVQKLPDLEPSPFSVNLLSSSPNAREMDDNTDSDDNGNDDEVDARPRKRYQNMSAQSAEYMSPIGTTSWLSSEVVSRCVGVIVTSCKPMWVAVDPLVHKDMGQIPQPRLTKELVMSTDKVVLPLHLCGNHWALALVLPGGGGAAQTWFYDSRQSHDHLNEAEEQVRRLLKCHFGLPGPEGFLREMACPQQPNGFDCGVYVIRNVVYLAADQPIPAPVDALLWRALVAVIYKWLGVVPTGQEEPTGAIGRGRLEGYFREFYLDSEDLVLKVVPTAPLPQQPITTKRGADAHYTAITEWHRRVEQVCLENRKKIAVWNSAMRNIREAQKAFAMLHRGCKANVDSAASERDRLELCVQRYQLSVHWGNEKIMQHIEEAQRQLGLAQERLRKRQEGCSLWGELVGLLKGAELTLESRIQSLGPNDNDDEDDGEGLK